MPDTHVVLIKCRRDLELIDRLPERIAVQMLANNGRLVSMHWTLGAYDAVAIVELDSRKMPLFALETEAEDVTSVVVMRAFDRQEAADALVHWETGDSFHTLGPKLSAPE